MTKRQKRRAAKLPRLLRAEGQCEYVRLVGEPNERGVRAMANCTLDDGHAGPHQAAYGGDETHGPWMSGAEFESLRRGAGR